MDNEKNNKQQKECTDLDIDNDVESSKELEHEKVHSKKKIYIVLGLVLGFIFILGGIVNHTIHKYEETVYPGNKLYGKDISKLTYTQVLQEINSIENNIKNKDITIDINKNTYTIDGKDIISIDNKKELSKQIVNTGKTKSIIDKYANIILKKGFDHKIPIELDEAKLKEELKNIASKENKDSINPSILIDGDAVSIIQGKEGLVLNIENALSEIKKAILNVDISENKIELFSTLESTKPQISVEVLKEVDTKISEFSTYYGGSSPRGTNIEVAAKKLDNLILMPNEEFSYENTIGPVSANNGYKEASVILNGKIQNGIGGGVCQVSSTLYNAQLKAGILPTERRNHSKAVDYVPRGLDATLASGIIDYKFKNTYDHPIVINAYTNSGNLFVEIWSNKDVTQGINYEPVSYVSGKRAESYLYGYDIKGKKVYEKFIDVSVYK